jgi:metal iron transporter
MNCPSRTEEPPEGDGMNQNPSSLSADLTTRNDLNGIANTRLLRRISRSEVQAVEEQDPDGNKPPEKDGPMGKESEVGVGHDAGRGSVGGSSEGGTNELTPDDGSLFMRIRKLALTFGKFIGPGFMVNIAVGLSL